MSTHESANLQNFHRRWWGIQIWIFRLIRILISVGSVPKCCGCIISSATVILPSMVQIGRWLYEKCNKCPKIPYSAMVKKMKNWSGIHTWILITTRSQSVLEDHPLPLPAEFGSCQFSHLSVILFTEWQNDITNDRQNDHNLCIIGGGNNNAKYTGNQRKLWIKFVPKNQFHNSTMNTSH